MASNTDIFVGSGEITIYDSTNGYLNLGHVESIELEGKPYTHNIIDGNKRQSYNIYTLDANIFNTSQEMVDELESRKATRQKVWIIGRDSGVIFNNIYLSYGEVRPFIFDEPQVLNVSAQSYQTNDVTQIINWAGLSGSFENFTGGIADFWGGGTSRSEVSTFLTASEFKYSGSSAQAVTCGNTTRFSSSLFLLPVYQNRKITASVYAIRSTSGGVDGNLKIQLNAYDTNGNLVESAEADFPTVPYATPARGTVSLIATGRYFLERFEIVLYNGPSVNNNYIFDSAQIELGKASKHRNF